MNSDKFRTIISLPKASYSIDHQSELMFIGSCFTEYIGNKFIELKFKTTVNPFGTLYNPYSIADCIKIIMHKKFFSKNDLKFYNNQFLSFYHDTGFSNEDPDICLEKINKSIEISNKALLNCDYLFISFGTARIYVYKENNKPVSNCHKISADKFIQRLLSVEEITSEYISLINEIIACNSKIKIIFTVSPVRHWKDGATGNQLSKSILFVSIYNIINNFRDIVSYFPAYEIIMDDLRDYRFYEADMLHPNKIAIDYIWDKLAEVYFNHKTNKIISEIEKILQARKHKPVNFKSKAFKDFAINQINIIESLTKQYPYINFSEEKLYFSNYI
jgi:hypothetical protein